MTKQTISEIICVANILAALALYFFTSWHFPAGVITGFCLLLLVFSRIGRAQANKAIDQVEKRIKDYENQ